MGETRSHGTTNSDFRIRSTVGRDIRVPVSDGTKVLLGVARSISRIRRPSREVTCRGDATAQDHRAGMSDFVDPGPRYSTGTVGERSVRSPH